MDRLLFILSVSLGSVVTGYFVRRSLIDRYNISPVKVNTFSKNLKLVSMFVLNPLPIISSFWTFSIESPALIFFPLLGVICTAVGGVAALLINALFRFPPQQAASVFTSGMFSNILTFGGLTAFVFFGIEGYVLIQLFNMLISSMYYLVGFPISLQVSLGRRFRFTLSMDIMKERPYLLIPIISIVIGLIFNFLDIPRPPVFLTLTSIFIPFISGLLGFSIGLTLYLSQIGKYRKYILFIALIKFGITPLLMASIGLLIGLPALMGGLPFKILIIASCMPVAFNSLIPPAIYGFDLDLANSAWIVTTFAFIVILPILYVVLKV